MADVTDISAFRKKRESYISRPRLEALFNDLGKEIDTLTRRSIKETGAVDIIAYELSAYLNAMRRALGEPQEEGNG